MRQSTLVSPVLLLLLTWILEDSAVVTQTPQVQVTYDIMNALESLTTGVILASSPPVDYLLSIQSLTPLTATAVEAEACPAGTYSGPDSQTCSLCQPGTYSQAVTATSQGTCVACSLGKYSNTSGASTPSVCTDCPPNTYGNTLSAPSLDLCLPCPISSYSYQGSQMLQSCVCLPGYSGPNGGSCPHLLLVCLPFFI